jgi:hypothetical protein
MGDYDDTREIFERLERLERRLSDRGGDRRRDRWRDRGSGSGHQHGRGHHHGCEHHRGCEHDDCHDDGFDEKRVIDTIVRCVTEQVGRLLDQRTEDARHGQEDGGGEKRIVDLIVGLVSEHVQEIVATELDRRLGRPKLESGGDTPPASRPDRDAT